MDLNCALMSQRYIVVLSVTYRVRIPGGQCGADTEAARHPQGRGVDHRGAALGRVAGGGGGRRVGGGAVGRVAGHGELGSRPRPGHHKYSHDKS